MSETDAIQIEKVEKTDARHTSGLKRVLKVVGLTIVWAFMSAGIVGTLSAAAWTVIPTAALSWGAAEANLIGYISHCSYTPISTLILLASASVVSIIAMKLKQGRVIGQIIFACTVGGLAIGLLGGMDIVMYIGMGAGLGIGVLFGLIVGFVRNVGVS